VSTSVHSWLLYSGQKNSRHDAGLRLESKGNEGIQNVTHIPHWKSVRRDYAAAVTFVFAIPGNSDYWRMEIWKRGGAAWIFDKNGHLSWIWTVEPVPDTPREKPRILPSSQANIRSEQL
jgi:hypothetical protein